MNQNDIYTHWSSASPNVGTGFDSRSSDNGLLTIMYGSLTKAHDFNWLNAGRTLVDKTYLYVLFQAKQLSIGGVTHHDIAPPLELFVRANLQPVWDDLAQMSADEKKALTTHLVKLAASTLFGSNEQTQAASWLLFYLCPQLPIFPMTVHLHDALMQKKAVKSSDAPYQDIDCYQDYQRAAHTLFDKSQPLIHYQQPNPSYGNAKEQAMVDTVLNQSDWWQRYCFLHYLQISKT
jgi:hypothetical protein